MGVSLKVEGVSLKKGYNLLIHNLNFEMNAGDIISLTGENGVGKTTLLRTLAGFMTPHAGAISAYENDAQVRGVFPDVIRRS